MCLYSKVIENKAFIPNAKNKGIPKICDNERKRGVNTKCGRCIECKSERRKEWQIRLCEEIKDNADEIKFITLTISEEAGKELEEACGSDSADDIARLAVRRFTERWRKEFKKAPRHWLSTELGGRSTERLHFHGFIWGNEEDIQRHWKYGHIFVGGYDKSTGKRIHYISEKSINYMTKYIIKVDKKHPTYQSKLFTSKGMGLRYIENEGKVRNRYKGEDTNKKYRFENGKEGRLPNYYKMKLWSDEERNELWSNYIKKNKIYIMGEELKDWHDGCDEYERNKRIEIQRATLLYYQKLNKEMGYGDDSIKWKQREYSWKLKTKAERVKKKTLINLETYTT